MATAKKVPTPTDVILDLIATDPMGLREALEDKSVVSALGGVGVVIEPKMQIRELHSPCASARTSTGVGVTLCGQKGPRHATVTCKNCLKKLAKAGTP